MAAIVGALFVKMGKRYMYHVNDSETYQNRGNRGEKEADIQSHAKRAMPEETPMCCKNHTSN